MEPPVEKEREARGLVLVPAGHTDHERIVAPLRDAGRAAGEAVPHAFISGSGRAHGPRHTAENAPLLRQEDGAVLERHRTGHLEVIHETLGVVEHSIAVGVHEAIQGVARRLDPAEHVSPRAIAKAHLAREELRSAPDPTQDQQRSILVEAHPDWVDEERLRGDDLDPNPGGSHVPGQRRIPGLHAEVHHPDPPGRWPGERGILRELDRIPCGQARGVGEAGQEHEPRENRGQDGGRSHEASITPGRSPWSKRHEHPTWRKSAESKPWGTDLRGASAAHIAR